MACTITIQHLNGVVPVGQTEITILRIIGDAPGCAQVAISSTALGIAPTTATVTGNQFHVDLPITVTPKPACQDVVDITVECTDGQCQRTAHYQLACCQVFIASASVEGLTPGHALLPATLRVSGEAQGCARVGSPPRAVVTVTAATASGLPLGTATAYVDDLTGVFDATIGLTATHPVVCGEQILLAVSCDSGTPCQTPAAPYTVNCPDCYRVYASVDTSKPCSGPVGAKTKDTVIDVEIGLPAAGTKGFFWDLGGGTVGSTFTATVTSASDVYKNRQSFTLAPGMYTAVLRFANGPPEHCVEYETRFNVDCDDGGGGDDCPSIDPPSVSAQCDAMGRRAVTFSAKPPAAPHGQVIAQWDYTGAGYFGQTIVMPANSTANVTQTVNLSPGSYTAKLVTILPAAPTCPDRAAPFTVPPCPMPPVCTLDILDVQVTSSTDCNPDGSRTVTATATLNSTDPADRYFWQWDPMIPASGLPLPANGKFTHDYPAPGTGITQRTITLNVVRSPTCADAWPKPITVDIPGCGTLCPQITALQIDAAKGVCSPDGLTRTVTLDASTSGAGITGYVWDFGDGKSAALGGNIGPYTTHDFAPGTYTVHLHAIGPGNCTSDLSKQITVSPCCPQLTGIAVSQAPCFVGTAGVSVRLTADLTGHADMFTWNFGDGTTVTTTTPQAPAHDYIPGTYSVSVTASAAGCTAVTFSQPVTVNPCGERPPPTRTQIDICAGLLWLAVILSILGVFGIVGGCIIASYYAYAGLIVEIIGWALLGTATLLFLAWWIFCRFISPCNFLISVHDFLVAMIAVVGVISAAAAIIAKIFGIQWWSCIVFSLAGFAYWGVVAGMLYWLIRDRKCLIPNPGPSGGGSSSASSSLLTREEVARLRLDRPADSATARAVPAPMVMAAPQPLASQPAFPISGVGSPAEAALPSAATAGEKLRPTGLGDVVKNVTAKVGIRPCEGCHRRAEILNRAFPFPGAAEAADADRTV
jgi:PKD domain